MELGPAPRKHAPPQAVYPRRLMGFWGFYRATRPRLKLVSEDLEHSQVISHDNHALGTAHAFARVTAKTGLPIMHQLGASAQRPPWLR